MDGDQSWSATQDILEMIEDAIIVFDASGHVVATNAAFKKIFPEPLETQSTLAEHADIAGTVLETWLRENGGHGSARLELPAWSKKTSANQRQFAIVAQTTPRLRSIRFHDRGEQPLSSGGRSEAQRRLDHLVEQAPLGVIEWNLAFECVSWNPAAEKIFGYTAEEAVGRHFTELISYGLVKEVVDAYWRELVTRGQPTHNRNENVDKSGKLLFCEWINLPYVDDTGRVNGVWSICNDLTERMTTEKALRESAEALEIKAQEAMAETTEKDRLLRELDNKFDFIRIQTEQILILSSPILEIWDGVLAVPLIGQMDETRTARLMEKLLAAVVAKQARIVLLDLTGMEAVDDTSVERLVNVLRAVELLGARGIVSGVQPNVARMLATLGNTLGIATCRHLRDGLQTALRTETSQANLKRKK